MGVVNPTPILAIVAIGLAGCAATTTPAFSETRSAELAKAQVFRAFAEPCSLSAPSAQVPSDAPEAPAAVRTTPASFRPGVFLETALFLLPTEKVNLSPERLARDPEVRLLGTPHLLGAFDDTGRASFEEHTGPLAETTLAGIAATPRQTADIELSIDLESVLLLPTDPDGTRRPKESHVHFQVAPRPGQPVASTEQIAERPRESLLLLLTPYTVRDESDLRAIFMCKMAQRRRSVDSLR